MSYSARDYDSLALTLKNMGGYAHEIGERHLLDRTIREIAHSLSHANPRFKFDKFVVAAGGGNFKTCPGCAGSGEVRIHPRDHKSYQEGCVTCDGRGEILNTVEFSLETLAILEDNAERGVFL